MGNAFSTVELVFNQVRVLYGMVCGDFESLCVRDGFVGILSHCVYTKSD